MGIFGSSPMPINRVAVGAAQLQGLGGLDIVYYSGMKMMRISGLFVLANLLAFLATSSLALKADVNFIKTGEW